MIDPQKNRLDYSKLLSPPQGFLFKKAIGTTYSIDLHTLLAIPVALCYSKPMEGDYENDRFDVLDSISNSKDSITIFCQKGKIQLPKKYHRLFAFVENSVVEYRTLNAYTSFHPKLWVIRYENIDSDEIIYRLIVLSRNLTFDRSWDVAFTMDGKVTLENKECNQPLSDFFQHIINHTGYPLKNDFLEDLSKTDFILNNKFYEYKFCPIGIPSYKNPITEKSWEEMMLISPFVDDATLKILAKRVLGRKYLFSRKDELDKINENTLDSFSCYNLSEVIKRGEFYDNTGDGITDPKFNDLHAKLYIGKKNNKYYWYLGSANLSKPAFERNIEFLVRLKGNDRANSLSYILSLLLDKKDGKGIFEEYTKSNGDEESPQINIENIIRLLEYDLVNSEIKSSINKNSLTQQFVLEYEVDISNVSWSQEFEVYFSPIFSKDGKRKLIQKNINKMEYAHLNEAELSIFVAFEIQYMGQPKKNIVVKTNLEIPKSREDRIIRDIINSKEKFIKYLEFMLSGTGYTDVDSFDDVEDACNEKSGREIAQSYFISTPLFEQLMLLASRNESRFRNIDDLLERLKKHSENNTEIIPKEFVEIWQVFKEAAYR